MWRRVQRLHLSGRDSGEHLLFALTWRSFTFPVGTVVTATSAIAAHTDSTVLTWMAVTFYLGLVGAWATVAARTARGSLRGTLFLPTAPARPRAEDPAAGAGQLNRTARLADNWVGGP